MAHTWANSTSLSNIVRCAIVAVMIGAGIYLRFVHLDADIPVSQNADDLGDEGYWLFPSRDLLKFGETDQGSNFRQAEAGAPLTILTFLLVGKIGGELSFSNARAVSAFYGSAIMLLAAFYYFRIRRDALAGCFFLGLYGLLPLTVFYSRIAHIEQHLLFYLFLAFVLAEVPNRRTTLVLAGVAASIALTVKSVTVMILPALVFCAVFENPGRRFRALALFSAGAAPITLVYALYYYSNLENFTATAAALRYFAGPPAIFISRATIDYFWTAPLVKAYLPFVVSGVLLYAACGWRTVRCHWSVVWSICIFVELSIWGYPSFARHLLLMFPLLHLAALSISGAFRCAAGGVLNGWAASLAGVLFLFLCSRTTLRIGDSPFFAPRYSQRDAALQLAALTSERDTVVGVHAFALALYGNYHPRLRVNHPAWAEIDPLERVRVTVVLEPLVFNGVQGAGEDFGQLGKFPFHHKVGELNYLERFSTGIYRVFESEEALREFRREGAVTPGSPQN